MRSVLALFRQSFWRAGAVYGQFWLMLLAAVLFSFLLAALAAAARAPAGVVAAVMLLGALVAVTFFFGAILATAAAAVRGERRANVWRSGWRHWGRVLGMLAAEAVWAVGTLVATALLAAPILVAGAVKGLVAPHLPVAPGANPLAAMSTSLRDLVLAGGAVVQLLAAPFTCALPGAIFVGRRGALAAVGPALRTGYTWPGFALYAAITALAWALSAAVTLPLSRSPWAAIFVYLVEPVFMWATLVLTLSVWRALHPGDLAAPSESAAAPPEAPAF